MACQSRSTKTLSLQLPLVHTDADVVRLKFAAESLTAKLAPLVSVEDIEGTMP